MSESLSEILFKKSVKGDIISFGPMRPTLINYLVNRLMVQSPGIRVSLISKLTEKK